MQHKTEIKVALAMMIHSRRAVCVSADAAALESRVGPNEAHTRAGRHLSVPVTEKPRLLHKKKQQPRFLKTAHGDQTFCCCETYLVPFAIVTC